MDMKPRGFLASITSRRIPTCHRACKLGVPPRRVPFFLTAPRIASLALSLYLSLSHRFSSRGSSILLLHFRLSFAALFFFFSLPHTSSCVQTHTSLQSRPTLAVSCLYRLALLRRAHTWPERSYESENATIAEAPAARGDDAYALHPEGSLPTFYYFTCFNDFIATYITPFSPCTADDENDKATFHRAYRITSRPSGQTLLFVIAIFSYFFHFFFFFQLIIMYAARRTGRRGGSGEIKVSSSRGCARV